MKKFSIYAVTGFVGIGGWLMAPYSPAMAQVVEPLIQAQNMPPSNGMPNGVIQRVQAPVISVSQIKNPNPNPKSSGYVYNVIYEYEGRRYSAQLPQDPGAYLTVQVLTPTQLLAAPVISPTIAVQYVDVNSALPYVYPQYTYVRQARVIYRPAPHYLGAHHPRIWGGHARHGGRH